MAAVMLPRLIASGLFSGYAPVAPGTAGSLVALILGAGLLRASPALLGAAALLAAVAGWWAVRALRLGDDPGWVVVDEFAGQWTAMLTLARPSLAGLAAAFVLFRLLDITKPGPVGWADRRHDATGVMADDLIAGAIVAGLLWTVRTLWPGVLE
jgi:phosphatidylglycerophosphatase A